MKNIIAFVFFITTLVVGLNVEAQNLDRFPRLRERIAQAKLREIKASLQLDEATFNRFSPVYLRYEQEVTSIDFRKMGRLMKVDADSLSTSDADELIVNQLTAAKQLVQIREKYYHEFRKVIAPQQIIKLYQTEAELRKKVIQELKRRFNR
jgi:hypothetical protein